MTHLGRLGAILASLVLAPVGCGKTSTPGAPASPGATGTPADAATAPVAVDDDAEVPADPREAVAWTAARDGDAEELMRLFDLVGCDGLHRGAARSADHLTALRAAQYCDDFSELPWLTGVATSGSDGDAQCALDAILEQSARPRRPVDREDADELHVGCSGLLALAKSVDRPRERRARAVSALRMLADTGCVKKDEIPADLDAK